MEKEVLKEVPRQITLEELEALFAPYTDTVYLPLVDGKLIRDIPPEPREEIEERLRVALEACRTIEAELAELDPSPTE